MRGLISRKRSAVKLLSATAFAGLLFAGLSARAADTFLIDFGADGSQTTGGVAPTPIYWNNVTGSFASTDGNLLPNLVSTNNTATDINLEIISRFNGANENGVTAGNNEFPASATRDSLYGNTEVFNGLENITPVFRLTGLAAGSTYTLKFYASRNGVTDNRETRYTITGATEVTKDLDVANNVTNSVTVSSMAPDIDGNIAIALAPGPNNNNANHFAYLGVLQIDPSTGDRLYIDFGSDGQQTVAGTEPPSPFWNNVTQTIGVTDNGSVPNIVSTNGTASAVNIQMVSRFNAANTAGATTSTNFPVTATQDSLFGNNEAFNGISNIKPIFKLTGLDPANAYTFTFYASRAGVADNRETLYTVTGANNGSAALNASANVENTVAVAGIRPNDAGEIQIALTPGPNNNNANHFTYLGVLKVYSELFREPQILIDFGADGRQTGATIDPNNVWNDVPAAIGSTDTGAVANLVKTGGAPTSIGVQMISRFNGANENGTEASSFYILDATRDSLFGNTELFGTLENITPIFKLTGLNTATAYKVTLYASRAGAVDDRETHYTLTGATTNEVDLQVAENIDVVAVVESIFPDNNGEIRIALTPGANNNNANHFVYLGVLQLDWSSALVVRPTLSSPARSGSNFTFTVTGEVGKTYKIERTADFAAWSDAGVTVTLTGTTGTATIPQSEDKFFYRAVLQ